MKDFGREKATIRRNQVAPDRLPVRATHPFLFGYHPGNWEHIEDFGWLPQLKRFVLQPGVNGCKEPHAGGHTLMVARFQGEGWTFIDDSEPVCYHDIDSGELVEEEGYLIGLRGVRGKVHCTVWDNPEVIGMGREATVDWGTGFDREGFNFWRTELMKRHGWKPTAAVIARRERLQRHRITRQGPRNNKGHPEVQAHVAEQASKLERMQADAVKLGVGKRKRFKSKREKVSVAT